MDEEIRIAQTENQGPVVIYHANCADGFAAAWCAWRAYNGKVTLYAAHYQQPPPLELLKDRGVYIVDFSYKRAAMLEVCKVAHWVTVLDHHKSAVEDLNGLNEAVNNLTLELDIRYSGAMLAWRWWNGEDTAPRLLQHIEDRDLWKFALEQTREVQAALFSHPYDMELWNKLMTRHWYDCGDMYVEGVAIERKHHKDVAELLRAGQHDMLIAGYSVPVANLPYTYSSDAGNVMSRSAPFAACYWDTAKGRTFSLRSNKDNPQHVDVATIAQQYGGGGHKHASGFMLTWEQLKLRHAMGELL